jgi:hypothetical protein
LSNTVNATGSSLNPYNQTYSYQDEDSWLSLDLQNGTILSDVAVSLPNINGYFNNFRFNTSDSTMYGLFSQVVSDSITASLTGDLRLATCDLSNGVVSLISPNSVAEGYTMSGNTIDPHLMVYYFESEGKFMGLDLYNGQIYSQPNITLSSVGSSFGDFAYSCADTSIYGLIMDNGVKALGKINPQTGEERKRDIKPEETVWTKYEAIFTNNYKTIDENYLKFLKEYKNEQYVSDFTLPYKRVWTLPVNTYASHYSNIDISLAPIKNHVFNRMKSQLKVIEAGFYKKALIASNVGPYTIDLTHSLKNGTFGDGNALLVDEVRSHSDWAKYIKKLVENPNLVKDMGERLYETVKDTYDLRTVTKNRREFYKSIVNVKTSNNQNLVHGY